ncbi:hypothetical protein OAK65_02700 [Synechococcus sp. AH-551-N17]|nr:hypothetical protein [Synechococcus sp. AH-551-N17]
MTPTRPTPFSESQRGQLARIKRIAAAEAAEKARMDSEALWNQARDQDWVGEALEHVEAIRAQQERQRLQNEIALEVVISDLETD